MRTLADTSVWMDHFRNGVPELEEPLRGKLLLMHSSILGELAAGSIPSRQRTLNDLRLLPPAPEAEIDELLFYVENHRLFGKGLSYVDCQLLASAKLAGARLLTRDKVLAEHARRLGVG